MMESPLEHAQRLFERGRQDHRAGHLEQAWETWTEAEQALTRSSGLDGELERELLIELTLRLAEVERDRGQLKAAQSWYERVVERCGPDPQVADSFHLSALAGQVACASDLGMDVEVRGVYDRVQCFLKRRADDEWRRVQHLLNRSFGEWRFEAELRGLQQRCRDVVRVLEHTLGREHGVTLTALGELGRLCCEGGRYAESEQIIREVLTVRQRRDLPADRVTVPTLLHNHAAALFRLDRMEEATRAAADALACLDADATPRERAVILVLLGELQSLQGEYAEAERVLQEARELLVAGNLGASRRSATALHSLAENYRRQDAAEVAEACCRDALGILQEIGEEAAPTQAAVLATLAWARGAQGADEEARGLLQEALHLCEKSLGAEHPDTAGRKSDLGLWHAEHGEFEPAELLYQEAIRILTSGQGPDDPSLVTPLTNLALIYSRERRYAEAEQAWSAADRIEDRLATLAGQPPRYSLELVVRISRGESSWEAVYSLPSRGVASQPMSIRLPIGHDFLDELAWYVEEHPRWRFTPDTGRARHVETRLEPFGEVFFEEVFENQWAAPLWLHFWHHTALPRLLTIETREPQVLGLPWELLCVRGRRLSSEGIALRRTLTDAPLNPPPAPSPSGRILVVTPRPDPERLSWIDHRTSFRALVETANTLAPGVAGVEFLYPPTYERLQERLADTEHPVHILHFDGHGECQQGGARGVLLFEDGDGRAVPVAADELGVALQRAGVALVVLEACRSAASEATELRGNSAAQMIAAGVPSVVALPFLTLETTTERFVPAFFRALFQGETPSQAARRARVELRRDPGQGGNGPEGSSPEPEAGEVEDWFVPVCYQGPHDGPLFQARQMSNAGQSGPAAIRPSAVACRSIPALEVGPAIGRSQEVWELERRLRDAPVVVVYGLAGQGKTALAVDTAYWLAELGFTSTVRATPFDHEFVPVGPVVSERLFSAAPRGSAADAGDGSREAAPTLMLWDGMDVALGLADHPALRLRMHDLFERLVRLALSQNLRFLITTRDPGCAQLAEEAGDGHVAVYELGGLAAEGAAAGATAALEQETGSANADAESPVIESGLLAGMLHGHPESLRCALQPPVLSSLPWLQWPAGFAERYGTWASEQRDLPLSAAIDTYLDALQPDRRTFLESQGVFAGGALIFVVAGVGGIDCAELPGYRGGEWKPLWQAGLLRETSVDVPQSFLLSLLARRRVSEEWDLFTDTVVLPFLQFHPLLLDRLRRRLEPERRSDLERTHSQHYQSLSCTLAELKTERPHEVQRLYELELPNFQQALRQLLVSGELECAATLAMHLSDVLPALKLAGVRGQMLSEVRAFIAEINSKHEEADTAWFWIELTWLEFLDDEGRLPEAEQAARRLIAQLEAFGGERHTRELVHAQCALARALSGQGYPGAAIQELEKTLPILAAYPVEADEAGRWMRHQGGIVSLHLAQLLERQGRPAEARERYETAAEAFEGAGDFTAAEIAWGKLAELDQSSSIDPEAYQPQQQQLERRLKFYRSTQDRVNEATTLLQLGNLLCHQSLGAWPEEREPRLQKAEGHLAESFRLFNLLQRTEGAASSATALAEVARLSDRYADAARWIEHAIRLDEETGNRLNVAISHTNLGDVLWRAARSEHKHLHPDFADRDLLAEAEAAIQRSLVLSETLDYGDKWMCYLTLARIAEARDDAEERRRWRREMRAAYLEVSAHWKAPAKLEEYQLLEDSFKLAAVDAEDEKAALMSLSVVELSLHKGAATLGKAIRRMLTTDEQPMEIAEEFDLGTEELMTFMRVWAALVVASRRYEESGG